MAPAAAEYDDPIATVPVNIQNIGVWPRDLKEQIGRMFGIKLAEMYTNKKNEATIYKVYRCQEHKDCKFRIKATYIPPDKAEIRGSKGGHSGEVVVSGKLTKLPGPVKVMVEELTAKYGAMRSYSEMKTRMANTFDDLLRSIASDDGKSPLESGRDKLITILENKRHNYLRSQQAPVMDLEEVVEECMRLGFTELTTDSLREISEDLHRTNILGRFDRPLGGDTFLLGSDKVRLEGCVVLSSRVGLITWFNSTHPEESPLLRPETKRIGITVGVDGCFKGARGGPCLIVMGPVQPTKKASPVSSGSVKTGFSLAPVLAVVTKSESSRVVERMVQWLEDLGELFHGDNRLRIAASITDASQALVKGLECSLDDVHTMRCQYHQSEAVKRSPLEKDAKAFVKSWIEDLYRCAGWLVFSKLTQLLLCHIRENYGEEDEEHCRKSWSSANGVMYLPCPVDLLLNGKIPIKCPVWNNVCEGTFSTLRAFTGKKPATMGGQGGMLENTRKFLVGYGEVDIGSEALRVFAVPSSQRGPLTTEEALGRVAISVGLECTIGSLNEFRKNVLGVHLVTFCADDTEHFKKGTLLCSCHTCAMLATCSHIAMVSTFMALEMMSGQIALADIRLPKVNWRGRPRKPAGPLVRANTDIRAQRELEASGQGAGGSGILTGTVETSTLTVSSDPARGQGSDEVNELMADIAGMASRGVFQVRKEASVGEEQVDRNVGDEATGETQQISTHGRAGTNNEGGATGSAPLREGSRNGKREEAAERRHGGETPRRSKRERRLPAWTKDYVRND
ncbi:hypothetical protein FOZ60_004638 [Perkinsus olseni]|uniref:SWIM-type domain-containing protein n=1 Tax=Perkinsus olseni TaxID=32597 RepID=A0A7J6NTT5_PEROL|nr:hypothetical protein FOZ60_004638 [Perkinsus olseni]